MKNILKGNQKLILIIALVIIGCGPSVFKPVLSDVESGRHTYADLSLEQLNKGYVLYADKCGSCHLLFKPKNISNERWEEMLPKMKIEAKLTDLEFDLIKRYLKAKIVNPL